MQPMRRMKTLRNRYGNTLTISQIDDNRWLIKPDKELEELPIRAGAEFIDFAGGPFIGNGQLLSELDESLPDDEIDCTCYEPFDKDENGYEYFGYVIHTKPND